MKGKFEKGHKVNLGKHHTEETKQKIRLANSGKKQSEEHKRKRALAHIGTHHKVKQNPHSSTLHQYIRKWFPKPELCQICFNRPPHDLANITGIYNREFENWLYLCRGCHSNFDHTYEDKLNIVKKALATKRLRYGSRYS